jgi:hypothetical protein
MSESDSLKFPDQNNASAGGGSIPIFLKQLNDNTYDLHLAHQAINKQFLALNSLKRAVSAAVALTAINCCFIAALVFYALGTVA